MLPELISNGHKSQATQWFVKLKIHVRSCSGNATNQHEIPFLVHAHPNSRKLCHSSKPSAWLYAQTTCGSHLMMCAYGSAHYTFFKKCPQSHQNWGWKLNFTDQVVSDMKEDDRDPAPDRERSTDLDWQMD